ncbi:MAG: UDP-N-acetylmuramoyl-L-alanine--D-glutamate ligase [Planctomycetota bacterium]
MDANFIAGKTVLVMGLGRFGGGVDVVKFACENGAKVIVTDLAKREELAESIKPLEGLEVEYCLGSHDPADFQKADIVVVNPAVPLDNKFVQIARKAGKRVTSQIELFFELCPATIIGITGANGKSTTASLTVHLLRSRFDKKVWLSGNIGNEPFLTILDRIKRDDLIVLEISSFQIEQLAQSKLAPAVAVLTNLTPNHLDRYGTFERYCEAKEPLFQYQKLDENHPAISIFNGEDEVGGRWFEKYDSQAGRVCLKFSADDVPANMRAVFALPGRANLSNLAAAIAVARHFGVTDEQIISCLPGFKALPHRLQLVAEDRGVRWYNDSKATTPNSTIVALEAFDGPIIIAGGYDKHIPFDELGRKIAQKAKAAILIGQTAQAIAKAIQTQPESRTEVKFAKTLGQAVELAKALAARGDVVVLSPACSSYDMFENYQQRGQQFIDFVGNLAH